MPNQKEYSNLICFGSLRRLLGDIVRCPEHVVEQLFEIFQSRRRHNDGIATAGNVLRDAQKPAAWIFLERKDKCFALDLNLVGFESVLVDRWFRLSVRTAPER